MTKSWQDHWEEAAEEEYRRMEGKPVPELLEETCRGRLGAYYTIWKVIARKASLEEAWRVLLSVLESDADYLHRYHAAEALLKLLGNKVLQPVDLSADHTLRDESIACIRRELEDRAGAPERDRLPREP